MTPDESSQRAEIDALRAQIDAIDRDIVRLLAKRLRAAAEIGRLKQEGEVALVDELREVEVQRRWRAHASIEGIPGVVTDSVLREIVGHSRRVQEHDDQPPPPAVRGPKIAFQGVAGAYSERAAHEIAARDGFADAEPIGFPSFEAALAALVAGEVQLALLPVQNSICGRIDAARSAIDAHALRVVGEIEARIEHCLTALPGVDLQGLRRVRSHPVALDQCRLFLGTLPHVLAEPWPDTADAARSVAEARDPTIAAICHEDAGRHHGLVVLRQGVADEPDNRTRFLLLAPEVTT